MSGAKRKLTAQPDRSRKNKQYFNFCIIKFLIINVNYICIWIF
ncbi:hypothetical protein GCWU000341_02814 [Oribacterium sp. oral taxon 078 str. F0262]|nr:hypothetical protein GCWU000341_02814 [Oribacterium sp. oral taxon 078 str. F0262]